MQISHKYLSKVGKLGRDFPELVAGLPFLIPLPTEDGFMEEPCDLLDKENKHILIKVVG